ncbi:MAG: hypothetical protein QXS37_02980 [Candidatus Aenigmatarchaeota archaeon]
MRSLRSKSFTNEEIEELTEGRWKNSTIKGYTIGIKIKDAKAKESLVSMLNKLVYLGLSLDDIKSFLEKEEALRKKHLSLLEVSDF